MNKIKKLWNLTQNMGMRYVFFRLFYEFRRKTGLLKKRFPKTISLPIKPQLDQWRERSPHFFFECKETIDQYKISPEGREKLSNEYVSFKNGKLKFFNAFALEIGSDYDWLTNPDSGHQYDINQHWTQIADLDKENGDIKYVWEKSRFTFLYLLIRYEHYTGQDQSKTVFEQIVSWIDNNPLNMGPNYKCSQETSLRILNWTFALHYYKKSSNLTQPVFEKIYESIYGQLHHVYQNINFSRIAVRNNHAITETMMLYLSESLFPEFKEAKKWTTKGKRYLEKEILYQIYSDGSYLQHSHNYHRVVIQLMTWACVLGDKSNAPLSERCKARIQKTLNFLYQHQNIESEGQLPNYGNNDGALFFPLNSCHYRDYRPQLNALYYYFHKKSLYENGDWNEDLFWYFGTTQVSQLTQDQKLQNYTEGGYYILREVDKMVAIRCASFKDRPAQADNLHVDIWHGGQNMLRDSGTYKYNCDEKDMRYFMGTQSHNTIMVDGKDQMEKGGRFIWYNWSRALNAKVHEKDDCQLFEGKINAFKHVKSKINHSRSVKLKKGEGLYIEVIDQIENSEHEKTLIWNPIENFEEKGYKLRVFDKYGDELLVQTRKGYISEYYGVKIDTLQYFCTTKDNFFKTIITYEPSDC